MDTQRAHSLDDATKVEIIVNGENPGDLTIKIVEEILEAIPAGLALVGADNARTVSITAFGREGGLNVLGDTINRICETSKGRAQALLFKETPVDPDALFPSKSEE